MQKHNRYRDTGIMLLRLGFGIMFMFHGFPKIYKGVDTWTEIGSNMRYLGIYFWPAFWGFLSAFTEFAGGILLIMGLFTRGVAAFLLINMTVASISMYSKNHDFMSAAHPIEDGIVFLSLVFIGGGRFSIDGMLR
jgi:putative oxidoreductase